MTIPGRDTSHAILIYDGDCPFCRRFARLIRLKETVGPIALINARGGGDYVAKALERGLNPNTGIILILDGHYHHGADALHRLAMLSGDSTLFNRLSRWVFRSPSRTRRLYPILGLARNSALWIRSRA